MLLALLLLASPITAESASRWTANTGWVTNRPTSFGVTAEAGQLVFEAVGAGGEIPFVLVLRDSEADADARYLLLQYRAEGLLTTGGNYFLHGWEGTVGGRTFAGGDEAVSDGTPQALAVDLNALRVTQAVTQLALKVRVGPAGRARVWVSACRFVDALPPGTRVSRQSAPESRTVRVAWEAAPPEAMTGWTLSPATEYKHLVADGLATFTAAGAAKGMRWRSALPQPLNLKELPYLSWRYRARGGVGSNTYAVWLGDAASGSGQHSVVAITAGELKVDGQWHRLTKQLTADFTATHFAIGLECDGEPAELSCGPLDFGTALPDLTLAESLQYAPRAAAPAAAWTLLDPASGGRDGSTLQRKLALSDWFTAAEIDVAGVPFRVPAMPTTLRQSGTAEFGKLRLAVPPDAREVYLLTATAAPPSMPFGVDSTHPRPVERLDQPEQVFAEVHYTAGPPDALLPVDLASGKYGVQRGLAVQVVHPAAGRTPREVVLRDRMQTASFAIVGAAAWRGAPRVAAPQVAVTAWPARPVADLATTPLVDTTGDRPLWRAAGQPWQAAPGLIFRVTVAGQPLPDTAWQASPASAIDGGRRFNLRTADWLLQVDVLTNGELRGQLRNLGPTARVATLELPAVSGLRCADNADVWYLSGHRGGVINRLPAQFRDPLGQLHALQCDGFFDPARGLALGCYTLDTVAQHHFVRLGKDDRGGSWSIEYPDRELAPGATFVTTPARLEVLPGDWRAILRRYQAWLASWYQPPLAKPFWEQAQAVVSRFAHYDGGRTPEVRGALRPTVEKVRAVFGHLDVLHNFGWSSHPTYGDWGDYGHYDETVGGLERFRRNIAETQADGVAVSLYLDGFLSSGKGQQVGAKAAEWAMHTRDGKPWYVPTYDAYNQCPEVAPWRDYLASVYARIVRELAPQVLYVDEFGATDGRWTCWSRDHGHNRPEINYAGEVAMLRQIRAAVGPQVALFSEYPPAEVSRQILDGSITYQAVWGADEEELAPHFVNLARFCFPAFKQLHIIHYAAYRAGNWWPVKFPFFNGETYYIGEPGLPDGYDEPALALQRRAVQVLCEHRAAFAAADLEPLVPTLQPGVYANRFSAPKETVWTLYNANGRSVRGGLLRVPHVAGTTYLDAWTQRPLQPRIAGNVAELALELGPKQIGCLAAQRKP
ncbi:MAG: hypothetical protein IT204_13670 [Fimbriimonadaceae bacterium]|nr:hypothetical protein [Fimbriimonadaceae bacterium]